MSAIRMIVLTCDGPDCENEASEGAWFTSVPEAVEDAKRHGWVRITRNGRVQDLCPNHTAIGLRYLARQPAAAGGKSRTSDYTSS